MSLGSLSHILLALLGGFLFTLAFRPLRFMLTGDGGQRLILVSASAGVLLAILGHALAHFFKSHIPPQCLAELPAWSSFSPFRLSEILALLFGPLAGWTLNFIPKFNEENSTKIAQIFRPNSLTSLLTRATDQKKPVMLTLNSGKVYVGFLKHYPPAAHQGGQIEIWPMMSGYREPVDSKSNNPTKVHFNTFYKELTDIILLVSDDDLKQLERGALLSIEVKSSDPNEKNQEFQFDPLDLGITIPIGEVEVATIYSQQIFDYFNPPLKTHS